MVFTKKLILILMFKKSSINIFSQPFFLYYTMILLEFLLIKYKYFNILSLSNYKIHKFVNSFIL